MISKFGLAGVFILLVLATLTACGGGDSTPSSSTSTTCTWDSSTWDNCKWGS